MAFSNQNRTELILDGNNTGAVAAISGMVHKLEAAEGQVRGMSGGIGNMLGSLGNMINPMFLLGGAAVAAATGFAAMLKNQIDFADQLNKTSQKVGFSVESLSTLKFAAELADVQFDQLTIGLGKLSKNLFEVSNGTGAVAKKGFEALGISVTDADGKLREASDLFPEIADKFSQMKNGSEKTAIAMTLFGRAGKELIPLLNQGKEGMAKMQEQARTLGLEISGDTAKQAEQFNDQLKVLKESFVGMATRTLPSILPPLIAISDSFVAFMSHTETIQPLLNGLGFVIKIVATAGYGFVAALQIAGIALGALGASLAKFLMGDFVGSYKVFEMASAKTNDVIKGTADAIGKLWAPSNNYNDMLIKIKEQDAFEKNQKAADALAKKWEQTSRSLNMDIAKNTMGALALKFYETQIKLQDLHKEFGNRVLIHQWLASIMQINKVSIKLPEIKSMIPKEKLKPTDFVDFSGPNPIQNYVEQSISWFDVFFNSVNENSAIMRDQVAQGFGRMANASSQMFKIMGEQGKAFFYAQKAFSIAEAIINTYTGATKALAQGGFFGIAMAATVIAAGLAQIATIIATNPGSTGGGAAPSQPAPPSNLRNTGSTGGGTATKSGQIVTINVYGTIVDHAKFAREFLPALKQAMGDAG